MRAVLQHQVEAWIVESARYLTSSLNLFICATIRREEKSLCHIAMVAKFAWQQTENSHKK